MKLVLVAVPLVIRNSCPLTKSVVIVTKVTTSSPTGFTGYTVPVPMFDPITSFKKVVVPELVRDGVAEFRIEEEAVPLIDEVLVA